MIDLINILYLYLAAWIVVIIHELGHFPEKLKINFGIIPSAVAMRAKYRLGGLVANAFLFLFIWKLDSQHIFLQYIGLIAWLHFIVYLIIGSVIPEPKPSQVDTRTYVFDDVNNEYVLLAFLVAFITFFLLRSYYMPLLWAIIN